MRSAFQVWDDGRPVAAKGSCRSLTPQYSVGLFSKRYATAIRMIFNSMFMGVSRQSEPFRVVVSAGVDLRKVFQHFSVLVPPKRAVPVFAPVRQQNR